jgi:NTE family protein
VRFIIQVSVFVCVALSCIPAFSANPSRPKVGVVLSGGGAKGFAHIALLRRLEALHIPIDYIGGTSMGGIIAALYAMGYSPDEIEQIALRTDWEELFADRTDRREKDLFQKMVLEEFPLSLDISSGMVSAKGLIRGQKISTRFSRLTLGFHHRKNFNDFNIPFLCIGTDIESGDEKIFREGDIVDVLRATMAIPTVFEPVEIERRTYLDGGIVNNFPVREVKNMGADILIGSDVGTPMYAMKEMDSFPKIMEQLLSINGLKRNGEQRALCNVLIVPDIRGLDATRFDKVKRILREGEIAVDEKNDDLEKIAARFAGHEAALRGARDKTSFGTMTISSVEFHNISGNTLDIAKRICPVTEGSKANVDDVELAVRCLYGSNYFSRVGYRLEPQGDRTVVHFYCTEKSERRVYAGFSFDRFMKGALYFAYEENGFLMDNAKAFAKVRIGQYGKIDTGYYVQSSSHPMFSALLDIRGYKIDYEDKSAAPGKYQFMYQSTSLRLGVFSSNWFLFSLGARKEIFYIKQNPVHAREKKLTYDNIVFYGLMKIDTFNAYHFPTSGMLYELQGDYVRPDLSFSRSNEYRHAFYRTVHNIKIAIPVCDLFSLGATGSYGSVNRDGVPPAYRFAIGGSQHYEQWIFPLKGYEPMEMTGQHGWVYSLRAQVRIIKGLYLIPEWNEGKTGSDVKHTFCHSGAKAGYGASLGYDFFLSPIEIGCFRKRDRSDYTIYFDIGFIY